MLQYILSSQYRQAYKFISMAGLLEESSMTCTQNFAKVRKSFETCAPLQQFAFVEKCYKVLEEAKKEPITMLNVLMFTHLLLQSIPCKLEQTVGLIKNQISIILANSHKYRNQKRQKDIPKIKPSLIMRTEAQCQFLDSPMFRQQSKAPKYLCDEASSPIKVPNRLNKSPCRGLSPMVFSMSNIPGESAPKKQLQNNNKTFMFSNVKQFLCEKLIQPYSFYLLKRVTTNIIGQSQMEETILQQHEEISAWNIINTLKLLFKCTECFDQIVRYYNKNQKYSRLLIHLIQIFDNDIKHAYPKLAKKVTQMLKQNTKQITFAPQALHHKNKQNALDITLEHQLGEDIQNSQNLNYLELKQILQEISLINEKMKCVYLSKCFYDRLDKLKIKMPRLMTVQNEYCEFVFFKQSESQKRLRKHSSLKRSQKLELDHLNNLANSISMSSSRSLKSSMSICSLKNSLTINKIIYIKEEQNQQENNEERHIHNMKIPKLNKEGICTNMSQASTNQSKERKLSDAIPQSFSLNIDQHEEFEFAV